MLVTTKFVSNHKNLQFSCLAVFAETVRFCNCFCETGYNCYNREIT